MASRIAVVATLALMGAFAGALMGMPRGHGVAGAGLMALAAGMLGALQTRGR